MVEWARDREPHGGEQVVCREGFCGAGGEVVGGGVLPEARHFRYRCWDHAVWSSDYFHLVDQGYMILTSSCFFSSLEGFVSHIKNILCEFGITISCLPCLNLSSCLFIMNLVFDARSIEHVIREDVCVFLEGAWWIDIDSECKKWET